MTKEQFIARCYLIDIKLGNLAKSMIEIHRYTVDECVNIFDSMFKEFNKTVDTN
jgi:hypothetical protein